MKKIISVFAVILSAAVSLTSCLSTGAVSQSHTVKIPESPESAAHRIAEYEKNGEYLYTTKAINWGDAECEIKIYDDKYLRITWPETGTCVWYYYKFYGDYLEYEKRKGIFGYLVGITAAEVDEIVFKNQFFGGYKFKSMSDQIFNDKKYQEGYITWNTYPAAKQPDVWHFLEFFQERNKRLDSKTDEVGNKKDLAGKVYYALTEKPGWTATWDESTEESSANATISENSSEPTETKTED